MKWFEAMHLIIMIYCLEWSFFFFSWTILTALWPPVGLDGMTIYVCGDFAICKDFFVQLACNCSKVWGFIIIFYFLRNEYICCKYFALN